jgi:hypothetical protein
MPLGSLVPIPLDVPPPRARPPPLLTSLLPIHLLQAHLAQAPAQPALARVLGSVPLGVAGPRAALRRVGARGRRVDVLAVDVLGARRVAVAPLHVALLEPEHLDLLVQPVQEVHHGFESEGGSGARIVIVGWGVLHPERETRREETLRWVISEVLGG